MEIDIDSINLDISLESSSAINCRPEILKYDNCLTYNDFFETNLIKNVPCIIKGVTKDWNSSKFWVINNRPNFEYLRKYEHLVVTVYKCSERFFNSQKTTDELFAHYLNYWKDFNTSCSNVNYLKDWHLKKITDDNFYTVPKYFASDWLNEYFVECETDDYRFVYMGPPGSWTPFHCDVFTSYSWSANVCGRKKWLFFAPGDENYLRDSHNNLPYDVTEINHNRQYCEIIQEPGDAIFVPSGWHHQVYNLDDTISINHNWINSCNIKAMYFALNNNLQAVIKELDDCKSMENFEDHCQVVLNSVFGMNYFSFFKFIKHITDKRVSALDESKSILLFNEFQMGRNHILFDLLALKYVLDLFCESETLDCLNSFVDLNEKPVDLLEKVYISLENKL